MLQHRGLVLAVVLVLGFGPVVWAYVRRVRAARSFARFAAGLRPRAGCPVAAFAAPVDPYALRCLGAWDGEAAPGVPATLLLLGKYQGSVRVRAAAVPVNRRLVGVYLPPSPRVGDDWLAGWRARRDVVAAVRAEDGGAAVVWKGLPSGRTARARMAALAASLV